MLDSNLIEEEQTLNSTFKTLPEAQKPEKLTRSKLVSSNVRNRESDAFDPFDSKSAFHKERSLYDRCFGYLKNDSLRTGAIGIITATVGTGVLALPNGIAHYGWISGIFTLIYAGFSQLLCYTLLGYSQSLVRTIA